MRRKIPETLTETEQEKLLKQPNKRYKSGHRNLVMLKVLLDSGLRLSELISLQWKDVNLTSGKLTVKQGKYGKDRNLWLGEKDIEMLREWKERQIEEIGKQELVFTTLEAGNEGRELNPRYVRKMVRRYGEKAGINKRVYPHMLRHTFATDLLRKTKNLRLVQKALGHADISTTQIYTHIVDEELEEALKSFRGPEKPMKPAFVGISVN